MMGAMQKLYHVFMGKRLYNFFILSFFINVFFSFRNYSFSFVEDTLFILVLFIIRFIHPQNCLYALKKAG